ncbi:MAG: HAMP domain-containing protein [Maricaulis sp.]|uniref:ATP-binding protein n=1 Tax=Maricaulis sp. TaxID=1486257 RepID=UPI001B1E10E5|nr:ATP-binding protein [Maricaulis sp.]MBO6730990.1 HAMP domain-containing protein [Maricaulis sp.]MBO6847453.1 HAMP domain-containing protein [Maricaulis sp.]MBO6877023.1 HAMP domain-containing protein [Maricaulis sp.]
MSLIRRFTPKGLFARTLLIIVMPVALMQVAVAWSFFEEHWETVTSRLSEGVAGDIAMMTALYEQSGGDLDAFDRLSDTAYETMRLSVDFRPAETLPTSRRSSFFRTLDRTLNRALSDQITNDFWFDTTRYPSYVDVRVEVDDGVLRFIALRERVFATTGHIFLLWIIGASTLLTAVSVVFIRNQVKPIRRLADAAEQFGRGQDVAHFRPAGATEVRQAAHAFLEMRARIKRHLEQRTAILAGVSHDLRTPLTRLKLQLALMPASPERDDAKSDIDAMEEMLDEYLDFARGQLVEATESHDLGQLAEQVVENARRGEAEIAFESEADLFAQVRSVTVQRALENLIGNATSFGDTVRVTVKRAGSRIEMSVEDNGPGIPEDQYDEALKPFNRLDESRNQNRKGVGLGLAIARDVARNHGGEMRLGRSDLGGLKATLSLPG